MDPSLYHSTFNWKTAGERACGINRRWVTKSMLIPTTATMNGALLWMMLVLCPNALGSFFFLSFHNFCTPLVTLFPSVSNCNSSSGGLCSVYRSCFVCGLESWKGPGNSDPLREASTNDQQTQGYEWPVSSFWWLWGITYTLEFSWGPGWSYLPRGFTWNQVFFCPSLLSCLASPIPFQICPGKTFLTNHKYTLILMWWSDSRESIKQEPIMLQLLY